ncbi:Ig-like domain-containing protein, partial [Flavobacterium hauense]
RSSAVFLTLNSAPAITAQPANSTTCAGDNTTFTAQAANATSYQWQENSGAGFTNVTNGGVYSGATTSTLTLTGATAGMSGYQYRLVATGGCTPNATTNAVTLTVNSAPAITAQPANSTTFAGDNTTFTAQAANATSYQWQENSGAGFSNITNGGVYSGATTATLTITGTTAGINGYQYRLIAAGTCIPNATSGAVTLTVAPAAPVATSVQIYAGTGTIANLTATGTNLKWYTTATAGTALIADTALVDGTTYYVSQSPGTVEGARASVTVKKISEATQTLCIGTTVAGLVSTPTSGATAKWYTSSTGGTALTGTQLLATGTYYVEQATTETTVQLAGGFNLPAGIAINAQGTIYVADVYNSAIKKMNSDGSNVQTIGSGFNASFGVTVDAQGIVYVADTYNNAIKKMNADGTNIQTIGSGFSYPQGVAVDAQGTIYVANTSNSTIKKMNADGSNIQTIGSGFSYPYGVAIDALGSIYVVDTGNNAIKKMNSDGSNIQTIGSGFYSPIAVAIDAQGSIYVVDTGNNSIKKMNADGSNIQIIGSGFSTPYGVAIDAKGIVHVADGLNNAVKKIIPAITSNRVAVNVTIDVVTAPTVTNVVLTQGVTASALTAISGSTGLKWYAAATGGTGSTTALTPITTTAGNISYWVASTNDNGCESQRAEIKVTVNAPSAPEATGIQIYAGTGTIANLTATGTNLKWYNTATGSTALTADTALVDGTTYYVSQSPGTAEGARAAVIVKKISDATQTLCIGTTVVGLGSTPSSGATAKWYTSSTGGTALAGTQSLTTGTYYVEQLSPETTIQLAGGFDSPFEIAVDAQGSIYVADYNNHAIKKMNSDGSNIQTLGSGFNRPFGVALDAQGSIYVGDSSNNAVKKMNSDGSNIQIIGSAISSPYGVALDAHGTIYVGDYNNVIKKMNSDGSNIQNIGSGFIRPLSVAVDAQGIIYVADFGNNAIKKMNSDGSNIQIIGSGFNRPQVVAVDAQGNIYVADNGSNTVKKMNSDGSNIQVIGSGFNIVNGVDVDAHGIVYVADGSIIKKIIPAFTTNRVAVNVVVSNIVVTPSQTNLTCNGGDNATATVSVTGGVGDYTYSWSPSGGTAATASGLTAGNYTVTVTDENGCEAEETFTITQPDALSITPSQTNVTCNGGDNATATVAVTGGTGDYVYLWSPTGGTAATASGLSAGEYTVTVTDENDCEAIQSFTITQPDAISITPTQENVSCNGISNGSATVAVSGGTGEYTYLWSPTGGTAATASGLLAGEYTVTVTDENDCEAIQSFTITQPDAISITPTQENVSCNGISNGSATVAVSGGTGEYTYLWSPTGGTAATASGLLAGEYTVTV